LDPGSSATVSLTSITEVTGTYYGTVVVYDLYTGCTYDELAVTLVVS
jgi:hypothetical protein